MNGICSEIGRLRPMEIVQLCSLLLKPVGFSVNFVRRDKLTDDDVLFESGKAVNFLSGRSLHKYSDGFLERCGRKP